MKLDSPVSHRYVVHLEGPTRESYAMSHIVNCGRLGVKAGGAQVVVALSKRTPLSSFWDGLRVCCISAGQRTHFSPDHLPPSSK